MATRPGIDALLGDLAARPDDEPLRAPDGDHFGLATDVGTDFIAVGDDSQTVAGAASAGAAFVYRIEP